MGRLKAPGSWEVWQVERVERERGPLEDMRRCGGELWEWRDAAVIKSN